MGISLLGYGVFFGVLALAVRSHSYRWRLLAGSYASSPGRAPRDEKRWCKLVFFGPRLFTSYFPVTVGLHDDGLSLRFAWSLGTAFPPLFVPFDEIRTKASSWYLNATTFGLELRRGNGVEILVDDELYAWIWPLETGLQESEQARGPFPKP